MITTMPWFRRVWTIQELVLAKDASMMCEGWEVSWEDFQAAIKFAGAGYVVTGADIIDAGPNRVLSLDINTANSGEMSLFPLLFLAINPRDHVFALLGLAGDGDQIEIDYRK